MLITHEQLKQLLSYDIKSGHFIWNCDRGSNKVKGLIADNKSVKGYLTLHINYKQYRSHRVVWFYHYGEWPKGQIDHINGIRDDNRIENLRVCTNRQNSQNRIRHKSGKLVGVHYHKASKKFKVEVYLNGKKVYLGLYLSEEAGHKVYIQFCKENGLL